MKNYSGKQVRRKTKIVTISGVAVLVAAFAFLELSGITSIFISKQTSQQANDTAQTTSELPTAQDDFSGGDDREPNQKNTDEGTLTDTGGTVDEVPPETEWSSSQAGGITVYSPAPNSRISGGQVVSGKASISKVSFRLIDNVSGVIAQGSVKVVDGKFSGKLDFSTTATEGRLDIFKTNENGTEASNIEIPIKF